jgi:hypothetical protein
MLDILKNLKWIGTNRRNNISNEKNPKSMIAGMRKWRNKWGKCRLSIEYPELDTQLKDFIQDKSFEYTTVTLNKNFKCLPHYDSKNIGDSYIIGLGDYTGGELNINGVKHDIKNKWLKFNGSKNKHWVERFTGDRYTLVYYKNISN